MSTKSRKKLEMSSDSGGMTMNRRRICKRSRLNEIVNMFKKEVSRIPKDILRVTQLMEKALASGEEGRKAISKDGCITLLSHVVSSQDVALLDCIFRNVRPVIRDDMSTLLVASAIHTHNKQIIDLVFDYTRHHVEDIESTHGDVYTLNLVPLAVKEWAVEANKRTTPLSSTHGYPFQ